MDALLTKTNSLEVKGPLLLIHDSLVKTLLNIVPDMIKILEISLVTVPDRQIVEVSILQDLTLDLVMHPVKQLMILLDPTIHPDLVLLVLTLPSLSKHLTYLDYHFSKLLVSKLVVTANLLISMTGTSVEKTKGEIDL